MIQIENLPGAELVRLYNAATGADVRRFESKTKGIQKLSSELEARGLVIDVRDVGELFVRVDVTKLDPEDLAFVAPTSGSPEIRETAKPDRRKHDHGAIDVELLEILRELGPSKIGAVRAVYLQRNPELASLTVKALKGSMRASVRRLEAAGTVRKVGMIFEAVR